MIDEDYVPNTIEEAARYLYNNIPLSEIDSIKNTKVNKAQIVHPNGEIVEVSDNPLISCHFGFGMYVRNSWSLWEDTPLRRHAMENYKIKHGDDLYGMIFDWVWALIQGKKFDTQAYTDRITRHWAQYGLNSFAEKE